MAVCKGGEWYIPLYDANGNITEYVNTNGVVVARYDYDAFGRTVSMYGTMANDFKYRFSTKYFDDETGFYYYGYRYYGPEWGRWISRDPIEEEGGFNLYGFCGNDGVNKWDMLGLSSSPPEIKPSPPKEIIREQELVIDSCCMSKLFEDLTTPEQPGQPALMNCSFCFAECIKSCKEPRTCAICLGASQDCMDCLGDLVTLPLEMAKCLKYETKCYEVDYKRFSLVRQEGFLYPSCHYANGEVRFGALCPPYIVAKTKGRMVPCR